LKDLIAQIEVQDEDEDEVFQIPSQPPYISPWNRVPKIPEDLDATKNTIQTPLILNEIRFNGLLLG